MGAISIAINEKQCLHYLLDHPEGITDLFRNFFITNEGSDLFDTLLTLYRNNIDFTTEHVLVEGNRRNSAITEELLVDIRDVALDPQQWKHYTSILKEDYAKNQIENVLLRDALTIVSARGRLDARRLQDIVREMQYSLSLASGGDSLIRGLPDMFTSYERTISRRIDGKDFYTTGCSSLDRALYQALPQGKSPPYSARPEWEKAPLPCTLSIGLSIETYHAYTYPWK
jgi:hypothetical protein